MVVKKIRHSVPFAIGYVLSTGYLNRTWGRRSPPPSQASELSELSAREIIVQTGTTLWRRRGVRHGGDQLHVMNIFFDPGDEWLCRLPQSARTEPQPFPMRVSIQPSNVLPKEAVDWFRQKTMYGTHISGNLRIQSVLIARRGDCWRMSGGSRNVRTAYHDCPIGIFTNRGIGRGGRCDGS